MLKYLRRVEYFNRFVKITHGSVHTSFAKPFRVMSTLPTTATDAKEADTISSSRVDLNTIKAENVLNYSYGLVIGAGIGDSTGSYLEFTHGNHKPEVIDLAMTMPGGGTWGTRVKPGQITDDTEMAISLCRGIVDIIKHQNINSNDSNADKTTDKSVLDTLNNLVSLVKNKKKDNVTITDHIYDSYYVAQQYAKWYDSDPFDIGGCTNCTVSEAPSVPDMKRAACDYNTMMKTQYKGSGNLANGSLMRCMPLIVYGYKLSYKELYNIMSEDSSLTHANPLVFVANTVYAISAQYLLQTHGADGSQNVEQKKNEEDTEKQYSRHRMAFEKGEKWLIEQMQIEKENKAFEEVYNWLMDCKQNDISKLHPATKHIGFVKIAFQRAFYHLWNGTEFETAIRKTISEGGDTDTNGCIVGGLVGALWGLNKIPKAARDKIMYCVPSRPRRDKIFQTNMYINGKYIENIIENAPNSIQIKPYEMSKSKLSGFESDN
eukprot:3032_1